MRVRVVLSAADASSTEPPRPTLHESCPSALPPVGEVAGRAHPRSIPVPRTGAWTQASTRVLPMTTSPARRAAVVRVSGSPDVLHRWINPVHVSGGAISFRPEPWIPQQVAGRWVQRPRPSPRSKWTDRRVRRRRRPRPAGRQHRSHPAKPTSTTTRHSCCQQSLWLPPVVAGSCRTASARSDCDSARAASARRAPAASGARSARQHRQQELLHRHA